MRRYAAKRLLWMVPTLLAILVSSYGMMRLAPGDPVRTSLLAGAAGADGGGTGTKKAGESATAKEFRRRFYLDRPWYAGFWRWLAGDAERNRRGVVRGDFGESIVISLGTPVTSVIGEKLPATLKLNLWSIGVIYLVAIPFGLYSAAFRGTAADRGLSFLFFVLYSLPSFWIGLLAIVLASKYLPWWPISGLAADTPPDASYWAELANAALHFILPVFCLSYGSFAGLSRYTRASVLETLRQDFVRTARAKGLPERTVLVRHVLRNSLIPLVTLFAGLLPGLIGGSVIVEYLFNIPGMGTLGLTALSSRDYPVLMTELGLGAFLVLVGVLVSDLLYAAVDPRITFE